MRPFCFSDVQRHIVEQHEEIRARLQGLRRTAAYDHLPGAYRALRISLLRFAAHFDAHLAFEERELAPRLRELDAWGMAREAALRSEHREQRTRLEHVCALAEEPSNAETTVLFEA